MIPEPKWNDSHEEWKGSIERAWAWEDGLTGLELQMHERQVSLRSRAVATAIFYTAADYNTLYIAPLPQQIQAWAECLDDDGWLTPELATKAVHEHFKKSEDGKIFPFDVLVHASRIGK